MKSSIWKTQENRRRSISLTRSTRNSKTIKNARKKLGTPIAPAMPRKLMKNKTTLQKGENSLQQHNLVHKFIPVPQAMKIPAARAAVDKEWEKLETMSAWNLANVRNKKGRRAEKFILHH